MWDRAGTLILALLPDHRVALWAYHFSWLICKTGACLLPQKDSISTSGKNIVFCKFELLKLVCIPPGKQPLNQAY